MGEANGKDGEAFLFRSDVAKNESGTQNNNNASIEGGVLLASFAMIVALGAVFLVFLSNENRVALVSQIAADAGVAAERAETAERRANVSELYAKQVFVELNRLGYPVKTPAEEHSVAPVEEPE